MYHEKLLQSSVYAPNLPPINKTLKHIIKNNTAKNLFR